MRIKIVEVKFWISQNENIIVDFKNFLISQEKKIIQ
jgi:hypothetical protein